MKGLLTSLLFTLALSQVSAQYLIETFDNDPDWLSYSEYSFDYVTHNGDKMDLFKQSDGEEPLMLATPLWNLSRAKKMEIDVFAINLSFVSTTVPELHIGYLEVEGDFSTFTNIHTYSVTNTTYEQVDIYLGAYEGSKNLAFKMTGDKGHIINLDNLRLYDEPFQSDIPTAISGLYIIPDSNGASEATARWTNPTLEADGDPLEELNFTDFYMAGTKIYSVADPEIGMQTEAVIEVPSPGFYRFDVSCSNTAGQGYTSISERIWIGLDVPGPVSNIITKKSGNEITLTWSPPEAGANDVYYDLIVDSYTVVRSDGKSFVIPGSEGTFKDILNIQGSVNYTITPENSSGLGTSVTSDISYHLEDGLLYYEDFYVDVVERSDETLDYDHKWTNTSTSAAFWNFFRSTSAGGDPGEMAFLANGSSNGNDIARIVSPVINTAGVPAVSIDFLHYVEFPASPNFSMVLETTSDGGQTWNEVERWREMTTLTQAVTKTVGNGDVGSENFQFAISVQGNTGYNNFARYDNFRVYYQPSIDAIAVDLETPDRVEPGSIVPIIGVIENGSTEPIDGMVTCEVVPRYGAAILESYTQEFTGLGIGEKRTIEFGDWESIEGEYELVLTITSDSNDEQVSNNKLLETLDVLQLMDKEMILLEEFTGTWCSYCPGAALGIQDLIDEGEPVVAVAYHRNDEWETATTQSKMDLYNVLGFPTVVFDGGVKVAAGDFSNSIVNLYRPIIRELKDKRVPMRLGFFGSEVKGDFYEAWIDITSPSIIENPNHVLRVALIEDGIAEEWQSLDVLDLVEKAYFETSIDLSKDGSARKFVRVELPDDMNIAESHAVIWAQSTETNEIFNAATISLLDVMVDNKELESDQVNIYPNPSSGIVYFEAHEDQYILNCYDMQGINILENISISNTNQLDLSQLEQGSYFLEFSELNESEKSIIKFVKI